MASPYSVFLTTRVEAQLRNAPPQLQGYVAGIIAALRVDPIAASVFLDITRSEDYRTIILPGGRGFVDYQVFQDQRVIVVIDLTWM